MNRFEWTDASSVAEAIALLNEGAVLKAGGVDLMDLLKERLIEPSRVVNLRKVPLLDRIAEGPDGLALGPMATLARIAQEPLILRSYTALAEAAEAAATPQIRNMATVGGNLLQRPRCWYFRSEDFRCKKKGGPRCFAQDGENSYHAIFGNSICAAIHPSAAAVALLALDASLLLSGPKGNRSAKLDSFFVTPEVDVMRENALGDKEIITDIVVPKPVAGQRSAYIKQKEKESFDWPLVEAAVVLKQAGGRVEKARVVLGSVAPVPYRALGAERALAGRAPNEETARVAARAAVEGATPLAQNGYKVAVLEAIVKRAILKAAEGNER